MRPISLLIFTLLVYSCGNKTSVENSSSSIQSSVIYGEDNRKILAYDSTPRHLELSKSVAVMAHSKLLEKYINNEKLETLSESIFKIFGISNPGSNKKICQQMKFSNNEVVGKCTVFLVAKDIVATAAHCVSNDYKNFSFVFNFKGQRDISKEEIYHPVDVLAYDFGAVFKVFTESELKIMEYRESIGLGPYVPGLGRYDYSKYKDIALLRLDREVKQAQPLELDFNYDNEMGADIFTLGHPLGLPLILTDNGKIYNQVTDSFVTDDLDIFKGNSGSPVFDKVSGKVIGIKTSGGRLRAMSFDRKKRCYDLKSYKEEDKNNSNLGGYMPISLLQKYLP